MQRRKSISKRSPRTAADKSGGIGYEKLRKNGSITDPSFRAIIFSSSRGFLHMVMGKESEEIYSGALEAGGRRLSKPGFETAISALIAGMYVTFSGLGALEVTAIVTKYSGSHDLGWLFGSMLYPVGFIFVVIGKSELFTENFVTPVLAAWENGDQYRELFKLWGLALVFNIAGVFLITYLIGISGFISGTSPARQREIQEFYWVAEHALGEPLWNFFWKAVFAGLLINFMSWLVIASKGTAAKLMMIWIPCFLIMLLGTHHSIVGSSEILLSIYHGAPVTYWMWFTQYLIPAVIGNALGGIVFVAALHYLQSIHQRRHFQ